MPPTHYLNIPNNLTLYNNVKQWGEDVIVVPVEQGIYFKDVTL